MIFVCYVPISRILTYTKSYCLFVLPHPPWAAGVEVDCLPGWSQCCHVVSEDLDLLSLLPQHVVPLLLAYTSMPNHLTLDISK